MVEVIICRICGETAEKCYCDYEAIEKAAEEKKDAEINEVDEEIETLSKLEED